MLFSFSTCKFESLPQYTIKGLYLVRRPKKTIFLEIFREESFQFIYLKLFMLKIELFWIVNKIFIVKNINNQDRIR